MFIIFGTRLVLLCLVASHVFYPQFSSRWLYGKVNND
uniref:Uncharacterized protein n=1 Tax=Rhizophora mucronata TaxID=61149 RepID=A0A2P2NRS8_RHIMU